MEDRAPRDERVRALRYVEPYHHYVDLSGLCHRQLGFGLEYLNYLGFVMDWVRERADGRALDVLDFGCGDGKLLIELWRAGLAGEGSLGVEPNEQATAFARAYSGRPELFVSETVQSVASQRPGAFDVVVSVEVIEHIHEDELPAVAQALAALLRPEGRLIVCVPSRVLPLQSQHYRHYDAATLHATFPQFEPLRTAYVHRTGLGEKLLRNLLVNRYWLLQDSGLRRRLYALYQRLFRDAGPHDGNHVVVEFAKASG